MERLVNKWQSKSHKRKPEFSFKWQKADDCGHKNLNLSVDECCFNTIHTSTVEGPHALLSHIDPYCSTFFSDKWQLCIYQSQMVSLTSMLTSVESWYHIILMSCINRFLVQYLIYWPNSGYSFSYNNYVEHPGTVVLNNWSHGPWLLTKLAMIYSRCRAAGCRLASLAIVEVDSSVIRFTISSSMMLSLLLDI